MDEIGSRLRCGSRVLLVSIALGAGVAQAADIGEPFELAPGGKESVGSKLTVRFVGVTEDTRCPEEADCEQAGHATVELELEEGGATAKATVMAGHPGDGTANALGHKLLIDNLAPSMTQAGIKPAAYRATVIVDGRSTKDGFISGPSPAASASPAPQEPSLK